MTLLAVCDTPVGTWWQLGKLPCSHGRAFLIGWDQGRGNLDSGVPSVAATVIAHALTSVAWATFPVSAREVSTFAGQDQHQTTVTVLDAGGLMQAAKAALMRRPVSITVVSTRDASLAGRVFDQPDYPWALQAQAVLLSATPIGPAAITYETWITILDGDWEQCTAALRAAGVSGLIRPGVDGDIAGVFALTQEFFDELHTTLEREAMAAGLTWSALSEADFASVLARH